MERKETPKPFWMKFYGRFFDKHEIKILLSEDRDYVFFYIAMLLESMAHQGFVRFNDKRSYSSHMLSHLLNMPEEKVDKCIQALKDFDLLEVKEDGTMFLPAAPAMCGCGTDSAERMRKLREKRKNIELYKTSANNVTECANKCEQCDKSDGSIEYRDKSIEYRDKNNNNNPQPPKHSAVAVVDTKTEDLGIAAKSSDEFAHISREELHIYFSRMRENGAKSSSIEIEERFWEYLVGMDFKKSTGYPITKVNVTTTFTKWRDNRNREERERAEIRESEENAKKAKDEAEQKRQERAAILMRNTLTFESDD